MCHVESHRRELPDPAAGHQTASTAHLVGTPRGVAVTVGVVIAALIATATRYGYHRDELYFLAAGHHLAWSYPDQGPLTPLLAQITDAAAPGSLTLLRLPSALAAGGTVLLTSVLAREFRAGRRAQTLAAAVAAVAVIVLFTGHTLSTATFDLLAWTAVTWLAVRAVRTSNDRLWLLVGSVLGIGLLNKPLPAFLGGAILAGVAVSGPRRLLRSRYVWLGAANRHRAVVAMADLAGSPRLAAAGGVALDRGGRVDQLHAVVADRPVPGAAGRPAAGTGLDRRPGPTRPRPRRAIRPVPGLDLGTARGRCSWRPAASPTTWPGCCPP